MAQDPRETQVRLPRALHSELKAVKKKSSGTMVENASCAVWYWVHKLSREDRRKIRDRWSGSMKEPYYEKSHQMVLAAKKLAE